MNPIQPSERSQHENQCEKPQCGVCCDIDVAYYYLFIRNFHRNTQSACNMLGVCRLRATEDRV